MSPSTQSDTVLQLPTIVRRQLTERACRRYPEEACGLLLGRREGGRTVVVDAREARNLAPTDARDTYELDPAGHLAAEEHARERGLDVVGIWHSHPDHPARPSERDRVAAWDGWSYVIVSVRSGRADELRSWRLEDGGFVEELVASVPALETERDAEVLETGA